LTRWQCYRPSFICRRCPLPSPTKFLSIHHKYYC